MCWESTHKVSEGGDSLPMLPSTGFFPDVYGSSKVSDFKVLLSLSHNQEVAVTQDIGKT